MRKTWLIIITKHFFGLSDKKIRLDNNVLSEQYNNINIIY